MSIIKPYVVKGVKSVLHYERELKNLEKEKNQLNAKIRECKQSADDAAVGLRTQMKDHMQLHVEIDDAVYAVTKTTTPERIDIEQLHIVRSNE